MKIFSADILNDRIYNGDNITIKKDDYFIIPETIHEINILWDDVLFYIIQ